MESEEHLIAARTARVVTCRSARRRPIADQYDQQMLLAMQGAPWDSKGKLATPIPMMGGMQATPAPATASSGGAEASTDRVRKVGESRMVEVPEDVPEEGEQDVRRERGVDRGSGQNILTDPTFAARVGMTPEQVQLAQDKGLLPEVSETTSGSVPTAAASGAAAASTSPASGAAKAVSGTASEPVTTSGVSDSGVASGSTPGVASGSTPTDARDSTVRGAETLVEELQANLQQAHKFVRLADEDEAAKFPLDPDDGPGP
eukprot:5340706-Amphidinium_carterae.2